MNLRKLGKTNRMVSEIGLGTWQLGTRWGDPFNEAEAMKILEASYDSGINLIDTADIYNDGNSEKAIGKFLKTHPDHFFVVTKCGRGLNPHTAEGYTPENMETFIDGSLRRLGVEQLDLVLLHCPPTSVYHKDSLFAGMDKLVEKGKIAHYGVSIEKVSEGLAAMEYPIAAMEVIFNMFRLKPAEALFPEAQKKASASWPGYPWPAACSQESIPRTQCSARTTTEAITATAKPLTRVKPSPGWTMLWAFRQWKP